MTNSPTIHQNPNPPFSYSMISLPNPTSVILEMIGAQTSPDGSFIPTEQTNAEWIQSLPPEVLAYLSGLINDEGYPLEDCRQFVEDYGYRYLTDGSYEKWAELTDDGYDNEAIVAFVEDNGIENIEYFEDAYYGEFESIRDAVEGLMENIGVEVPDFVVIDYEATWDSKFRHDFTFEGGYLFNNNW